MERKFVQPVSMPATQEQFENELRKPLKAMGYQDNWSPSHVIGELFLLTYQANGMFYYTSSDKEKILRLFSGIPQITNYNPELFLAIAAISATEEIFPGEWLVCVDKHPLMKVGHFYQVQPGDYISGQNSRLRKATLEELIEHFTQPSVEVKQEWEPKNGEEYEFSDDETIWVSGLYVSKLGEDHVAFVLDEEVYAPFDYVRKKEFSSVTTFTRTEAEQKLSELVGKPVVIKD